MLTVEEIKKIFDNFEVQGFRYDRDSKHDGLSIKWLMDGGEGTFWENYYYPLFLQRVIEGINKKYNGDSWILINYDSITFNYDEGESVEEFDFNDGIDQAKEQAIKYILDKI